ncbi:MAG: DUF2294 family protein [Anaerolineales bacterium]|nr:DUF2294 family protein [Anaerolineales bacterium]
MPGVKRRGEYEDELTKAIIKFEVEQLGRGPEEVRTFILGDMILFRLKGVLTPAESTLAQAREGQELVKEMRRQLNEASRHHHETQHPMIVSYEVGEDWLWCYIDDVSLTP